MTRFEYFQRQIDNITDTQLQIYKQSGEHSYYNFLEKIKSNIKKKQMSLTIEGGDKKANLLYRIFN